MRDLRNKSADGQEVELIDVTGAIEVTEAFDRAVRKKYDACDIPTLRELYKGYEVEGLGYNVY